MAVLIHIPLYPESKSSMVHIDEEPPTVTAKSEWMYTEYAIKRWMITKSIAKEFRKKAPVHWVDSGWVKENSIEQLTLF